MLKETITTSSQQQKNYSKQFNEIIFAHTKIKGLFPVSLTENLFLFKISFWLIILFYV